MFSGIVERMAEVVGLVQEGDNLHITLTTPIAKELTIDQSVSHNGVCLTVVRQEGECYTVTAIRETLERSNLGLLQKGSKINLERSMKMDGRLDGHIVQGHVDCKATCKKVREADGSYYFLFEYDVPQEMARKGYTTVEKGSITVNGVSLTVCNSEYNSFEVAIIPYTFEHTNFCQIKEGTIVNLEFDIIGKYLAKLNSYC